MLFYLTDTLIIDKTDVRYGDVYKTVRNLSVAADESSHLLMGDYNALDYWRTEIVNDPCSNVLTYLCDNFATTSIPSCLTEYVEVVLDNPHNRIENNLTVYQLSYKSFLTTDSVLKTHVIGEDENDSILYGHILEWYKRKYTINSNTNYIPIQGAGGNISRPFQTHINQRHITVCLTDTDKRYPNAPEGITASACRNVICQIPLGRLYVIDAHEIENLIPKDVIDSLTWNENKKQNKNQFDALYDNIPDKDNLRYVDLKSGYSKHVEFSNDALWVAFARYCCECNPMLSANIRENFQATFDSSNFKTVFMVGLSSSLLKDTISFFDSHPAYNPTNFIQFQLDEWNNIGQMMLDTCICRNGESLNI